MTKTEKIESIQTEIKQLENQRKRLIQQQKEQERKDRTKRLCKRAGLMESMLPETITLNDEQFKSFLEKTLLNESSRKALAGLTAIGAGNLPGQVGSMSYIASESDEAIDGNGGESATG